MNAIRATVYFVGIGLVLLALWMFFVQAGLNRWVPVGIALAAVVLIIGVSVMSFAEKTPIERTRQGDVIVEERPRGGNVIVERPTRSTMVVERDIHRHD